MLVASALSGITSAITDAVGNYGLYAVFGLMMLDAVFPAASELVMVYGGAVAAGAFAGQTVTLFGHQFEPGLPAYLAISLAGTIGYLLGSLVGWWIGRKGGHPFLERSGHRLHLEPERVLRAERWFDRWGEWAVFLGRITPVVRSFISIPAGVFEAPLRPYTLFTAVGSAIWCFGFAAVGWAAGSQWEDFQHAFRFADYAILGAIVAGIAFLGWKRVKNRRARKTPAPGYTDASE
jgi:membrane protein DedA with SNARE-associated domain